MRDGRPLPKVVLSAYNATTEAVPPTTHHNAKDFPEAIMTTSELELAEDTEADRLMRWRVEELQRAG